MIHPHRCLNSGRRCALLFVSAAIVGWGLSAGTLAAPKSTGWLADKNDVVKILKERSIPADQAKKFDAYFKDGFLLAFSSNDPSMHDNLPRARKELQKYLAYAKTGEAHDRLNDLTFDKMKQILSDKKSDAASKYNALLMIGELNEEEPDPPKSGAKPLPKALALLMSALKAKQDYMKVAALIGLERHAAAGAFRGGAPGADKVTTAMLELLKQAEPPADRSPDAHNWMRRSAAQTLASIGSTGPDGSVLKAYLSILNDPQARPTLRCDMAQFIGQLKHPPGKKIDLESITNSLGYLVVDVCQQEVKDAQAAGRPPSRRLAMYAIAAARTGIFGTVGKDRPATEIEPGQQDLAVKVYKKLTAFFQSLDKDNEDLDDATMIAEVSDKLDDLETALGPKKSAKVADKPEAKGKPDDAAKPDALRAAADPPKVGTK